MSHIEVRLARILRTPSTERRARRTAGRLEKAARRAFHSHRHSSAAVFEWLADALCERAAALAERSPTRRESHLVLAESCLERAIRHAGGDR